MKKIVLSLVLCLLVSGVAKAEPVNFPQLLNSIQNSNWVGQFSLKALGWVDCEGPIVVKFFPEQIESFSDGIPTVSYRHDADFSKNLNPLCQLIGKAASVVDVGQCGANFPMKYNPDEKKMVPFRTIIPRDGGANAFVSSPSCGSDGKVHRQEFQMTSATLSPDQKTLDLVIEVVLGRGIFPQPVAVDVHYKLNRVN
jgi:hypothetical protein